MEDLLGIKVDLATKDAIKPNRWKYIKDDRKTIDAVRNFEIIGEASKFIPDEIKEEHQEVDSKGIIGLRNRIAHEYFGISTTIICI